MNIFVNKWLHIFVLSVVLVGAVFVRIQDYDWIKSFRYIAFDYYNEQRPRQATDKVVMVDIDEASMADPDIGQWPWPRDIVARLVENLSEMGAKTITFDMVFAENDRTSPKQIARKMPEDIALVLENMPDNDQVFAKAISDADNVILGFIWTQDSDVTHRLPINHANTMIKKGAEIFKKTAPFMTGIVTNIPALPQASAGSGSFGVSPEVDGIVRKVPLIFRTGNYEQSSNREIYPSLAIDTIRVASNRMRPLIIAPKKYDKEDKFKRLFGYPFELVAGEYKIPLDIDGNIYTYFSEARDEKYISARKIIHNEIDPELIKDKIVFIGTSAEGLKDIRSTPLNLFIPGVEMHMNVVEQILTGEFLTRTTIFKGAETIAFSVAGIFLILLSVFIGTIALTFVSSAMIASAIGFSWYAFSELHMLFDPVYFSVVLALLYVVASLFAYLRSETEKKRVRQAFGLYISPDYMVELTENPDALKLGGETKELSVMFTDIRSFTSISEKLSPEELITLMNDFLTPMSNLVMENRGTIDKYMGDAMMAFWNAPLEVPDHALMACKSALEMNKALIPINEKQKEKDGENTITLKAGIGIATGEASVGNMGSKQRFAYSALGDTVNLASRLEGQTKNYGVTNLVNEQTVISCPELAFIEADIIKVKGKQEPVRIFTLIGDEEYAKTPDFLKWRETHDEMLYSYRNGDMSQALSLIEKCRDLSGAEFSALYDLYASRIHNLTAQGIPENWDGVFTATEK